MAANIPLLSPENPNSAAEYATLNNQAKQLLQYFHQQHRFSFIKSLHSAPGGVLLVNEFAADGATILRKLVIKHNTTLWDLRDQDIATELNVLTQLRGAEHIAQIVTFQVTPVNGQPLAAGLLRPFFVAEYVHGGTITQYLNQPMVEEVMWSIFLCLIRACIAMAYPPNGPIGGPTIRETIPIGRAAQGLMHDDLHTGNVVIGDFSPGDFDHVLAPLIKVIDFGGSVVNDVTEEGIAKNIMDVGLIMLCLAMSKDYLEDQNFIWNRPVNQYPIRNPPTTVTTPAGTRTVITTRILNTEADPALERRASLSTDLKEAIALCMAEAWDERPSLPNIFALCRTKVMGVSTRRAAIGRLWFDAP